ncbi:MAG: TlpA family protein disulfide reductase [Alphaproteobacteria bacterium]|nr:TlpA family protein disulfide reductase [Alphaproteobacteria bacterium]
MTRLIAIALMCIAFLTSVARAGDWRDLHAMVAAAAPIGVEVEAPLPMEGPVIVTFFASWCPPCTDEFGHLNDLADTDAFADTTIVAINLFEDFGGKKNPARMERFLKRTKPQFRLVEGTDAMRTAFGQIDRIPTVIVYGNSGEEIWRFVHERNAAKTHATRQDLERVLMADGPRS